MFRTICCDKIITYTKYGELETSYSFSPCLFGCFFRNSKTIFRKENIFTNDPSEKTTRNRNLERTICQKLYDNPQKNIVTIYNINDNFIEMEYLNTEYAINSIDIIEKVYGDITDAITQLHELDIVYIDLKLDNIGYSKTDNCFKLFDFDCSGIVNEYNTKKWKEKPYSGYIFKRNEYYVNFCDSLYDLDFFIMENELLPEINSYITAISE